MTTSTAMLVSAAVNAYQASVAKDEDTRDCANVLITLRNQRPQEHPLASPKPSSSSDELNTREIPGRSFLGTSVSPTNSVGNGSSDHGSHQSYEGIFDLKLLDDSPLVKYEDRHLVPDALFVAMAQMNPCYLKQADRVGCYKSREIGFAGFACRYCGGQPGFGRYFPASVRSLAQTTTSQTILKHVTGKCRFVPSHIRDAIIKLHSLETRSSLTTCGRPRYGSRKVFFQKVWGRLQVIARKTNVDALQELEAASGGRIPRLITVSETSSAAPSSDETDGVISSDDRIGVNRVRQKGEVSVFDASFVVGLGCSNDVENENR